MKKIMHLGFVIVMAGLFFSSCKKADLPSNNNTAEGLLSTPQKRQELGSALKSYFQQKQSEINTLATSRADKFITPFFTESGWGIGVFDFTNFSLELANFSAVLTGNDFYRINNDGTLTIHVNSNNALAEYTQNLFDPTALYLSGTKAHYDANYTGTVVELFPGFYLIDTDDPPSAVSIHGNGKVQENGSGPVRKLSIVNVVTPSGQSNIGFTLN